MKINWRPDRKDLRDFGITILVGFSLVGAMLFLKNQSAAFWAWGTGAVIGGIGFTGRRVALPFYWAWMSVAFVMGNIMSRVIMAMVYVGVVTPLAFLMKLIGRDRLGLRRKDKNSYWTNVMSPVGSRENYERQF